MRYAYPCVLTPEEDGGFSVSFPNVPEALTCGDDRAEALAMAEDALAVALGAYVRDREDIPLRAPCYRGRSWLRFRWWSRQSLRSTRRCVSRGSPRWDWPHVWE